MIARLTRRQRQVFIQRALGRSTRGIAVDLGITLAAVEARFVGIRKRLGLAPYDVPVFVRLAAGPLFFAT